MFLSRNKKNNIYPCKPQFNYIKMGFQGAMFSWCFQKESKTIMTELSPLEVCQFPFKSIVSLLWNYTRLPYTNSPFRFMQFQIRFRKRKECRIHLPRSTQFDWKWLSAVWNSHQNNQINTLEMVKDYQKDSQIERFILLSINKSRRHLNIFVT